VATPEAIAGLDIAPGDQLLSGNDAQSLADAAVGLLSDAALWRRLSDSGRALIQAHYRPQTAFIPLEEALTGAIAKA
jgi:glycosyltransferase involved in cell wall biosynthesis